jgi:hypothetical protein
METKRAFLSGQLDNDVLSFLTGCPPMAFAQFGRVGIVPSNNFTNA